ncbi:NAD(P)/FAD-dependent oxidoreductase [Rhodobacter capsulatus]|jgi:3-phenylpropionate/trans-cinnamate dioxygenase ferredoxin reductase subunit|uniref:Rhodocoxin reductase n=1 Tax=Rhodobacter capsulatus (strain ATCC BAA-309 / NBRC 16581 / SB1003) TaxID=272942 RepID=D5ASP5_RHOCB|nr:FAD-dependent oxidoreductase [Rhodobacter capsulatus]ADE87136.1 rhodocoxin reductase [Rhodobacter capsulatus SB 1003]ETD03366.1 FAD-dependent pyridine nucleotide-disulfide oxidoreductase [Rhodobacter capsulatus DE442]ETD80161.1 FAD-dependent pyridine nucleotide-disulfide oxidoreductase [Rhodobacter capsulatus R121]ETE55425.1 FAD-dependent pyridine nucleotide-disulfide oxidoreductase [Rhodobacter capsulatus Y262]MDS0925233.1 FAD-dependent oxidoreductase [Rhodobacter capsulatus]
MSGIVIVGGGQAAASLAAKARALGYDGDVTILGEEPVPPYQRPPLSKAYLLGEMPLERLTLRGDDWYAANRVTLRVGTRVTGIDRAAKAVLIGDERLPYDHLALCTGAVPRHLPAEMGAEGLSGIYTLRDLADTQAMADEFVPGRNLVVVGGGYIGLEAAAVACKRGLTAKLVHTRARILRRVAGVETANAIREMHRAHGVEILEDIGITRVLGEGRVSGVELADGRILPADFIVVGIGVDPRTDLAAAAGLLIDEGIAVDEFGRTSDPSIWAAGDCAALPGPEGRMRIESVGNAIDMGELVAENMLGAGKAYQPKPWFWSDQFASKLQIAGLCTGHDRVVTRTAEGQSFWYFREGRLIAVDALDAPRAYMIGKRLIEGGKAVTPEQVEMASDLKALMA